MDAYIINKFNVNVGANDAYVYDISWIIFVIDAVKITKVVFFFKSYQKTGSTMLLQLQTRFFLYIYKNFVDLSCSMNIKICGFSQKNIGYHSSIMVFQRMRNLLCPVQTRESPLNGHYMPF